MNEINVPHATLEDLDIQHRALYDTARSLANRFFEEAKAISAAQSTPENRIQIRIVLSVRTRQNSNSWSAYWMRLHWSAKTQKNPTSKLETEELPKGRDHKYPRSTFRFCPQPIRQLALMYEDQVAQIREQAAQNRQFKRQLNYMTARTQKLIENTLKNFDLPQHSQTYQTL